jgi:hypothetical protein
LCRLPCRRTARSSTSVPRTTALYTSLSSRYALSWLTTEKKPSLHTHNLSILTHLAKSPLTRRLSPCAGRLRRQRGGRGHHGPGCGRARDFRRLRLRQGGPLHEERRAGGRRRRVRGARGARPARGARRARRRQLQPPRRGRRRGRGDRYDTRRSDRATLWPSSTPKHTTQHPLWAASGRLRVWPLMQALADRVCLTAIVTTCGSTASTRYTGAQPCTHQTAGAARLACR